MAIRDGRWSNNIGIVRLILASAVIVGHAPEMIDGTRAREWLTRLFGSLSLGEVAVDGFFILSGYLIVQSFVRHPAPGPFLRRRAMRIYPAFLVASIVCVYVLAPILGADPFAAGIAPLLRMAVLNKPLYMPSALDTLAYPLLNNAMWTIAYEFRCYLLVALLGRLGLIRANALTVLALVAWIGFALTEVSSIAAALNHAEDVLPLYVFLLSTRWMLRFTAAFLIGGCLYMHRDRIFAIMTWPAATVATALMLAALSAGRWAEPLFLPSAAAALFWLCFRAPLGRLRRVNNNWDISYGTYLYGWPIASALILIDRSITPAMLAALTLPLAWAMGAASWAWVEAPVLRRQRRGDAAPAAPAITMALPA